MGGNHTDITVPLTQNKFAIIDECDDTEINLHKWCYDSGYAQRRAKKNEHVKTCKIKMHRMIWALHNGEISSKMEIDHINRNKLDNRLCNLRLATRSQNTTNCIKHDNCTSKYKGVHWHKRDKKWYARCGTNIDRCSLGYFDSEEDAARAYDKKAKELYGVRALLNFSGEY